MSLYDTLNSGFHNAGSYLDNHVGGGLRDLGNYTDLDPVKNLGEGIQNLATNPAPYSYQYNHAGPSDAYNNSIKALSASNEPRNAGVPTTLGNVGAYGSSSSYPQFTMPLPGQPNYRSQVTKYLGSDYDLNDPTERLKYFQDHNGALQNEYQNQISNLDRQYQTQIDQAQRGQQEGLGQLRANRTNLATQAQGYARGLTNNLYDLGQGYNVGRINNQAKFSSYSPNAYQSSQGTTDQYLGDQYGRGQTALHQQQHETIGDDYFNNGGKLADYSQLGQQEQGYNRQESDLNANYGSYLKNLSYEVGQQKQGAQNSLNGALDQVGTELGHYDNIQNHPQTYATQAYNPYQVKPVDLAQYTPLASAGAVAGSPGSSFFAPQNGPTNDLTGLSKTAGQPLDPTHLNYLQSYLGGNQ